MSSEDTQHPEAGTAGGEKPEQPLLRVLTPDATPEEVAAVVAVFSAMGGQSGAGTARSRPQWNTPSRMVRGPAHSGPGGWRSSGLPR